MANYTYGKISIELPEHLQISAIAGKLTADKIQRMPKANAQQLGVLCQKLADIMDANPDFTVPEVTSAKLRTAGIKSEDIKAYVLDLDNTCKTFRQQSLIYDNLAYELVRRVNTHVKGEAKYNAQIKDKFASLFHFFDRPTRKTEEPKAEG